MNHVILPIAPDSLTTPYSLIVKAFQKAFPGNPDNIEQVSEITPLGRNEYIVNTRRFRSAMVFSHNYDLIVTRPNRGRAQFTFNEKG
jgi:hypothetical protein